jgi:adenylate cyclase
LERKERLVRDALPDGGRVVKELGDGLLIWFDDAAAAITTCVALQIRFEREATADLPLWVRMGLHWGCPRHRGDDIVGRDVNLAARIVELAGPGEVLCSEAATDAAGRVDGVSLESLGPVFLRGFEHPVSLVRAISAISV